MRVPFSCMTCFQVDGRPDLAGLVGVPITDSGIIRHTCGKGHLTVAVVQQQRFEVLSEIGKNAIIDGYNREGVASFASALERFHEFYCRVVWRTMGLPPEQIQDAWRDLSHSERQVGAFVAAHLMAEGQAPTLLSNPQTKFRNDVIHNGYIPNAAEAVSFGQAVIDLCEPVLARLKTAHADVLQETALEQVRRIHAELGKDDKGATTISLGTPLSLTKAMTEPPTDLAASIARESSYRRDLGRLTGR